VTSVARRIASIPRRGAVETWRVISDLLAPAGTVGRVEFDAVKGVAAAIITEEYTATAPIILSGTGPQVRIYTVHGDAALEADLDEELDLPFAATEGDWAVSLPALGIDVTSVADALGESTRITVRDASESHATIAAAVEVGTPSIDLDELERP
jgi:hypothetical protein